MEQQQHYYITANTYRFYKVPPTGTRAPTTTIEFRLDVQRNTIRKINKRQVEMSSLYTATATL